MVNYMKSEPTRYPLFLNSCTSILLVVAVCLLPRIAFAGEMKMPYEDGLAVLQESLTGTVAFAISMIGIVACGAMLIFGGEISGFMRTMIFIVLVAAVIVQSANIIEMLKPATTLRSFAWVGQTEHRLG